MLTLTVRPYRGETDLQPIADLLNTCEAVDQLDEATSAAELQAKFEQPSFDKARDTRLWENADGQLIGFSQLWIPPSGEVIDGYLWFRVHPQARGRDLEQQIIAWGEQRMREVGVERGVRVQLRCGSRNNKTERIALLESCGFTADRYFLRMTRMLSEPIAEPQFPAGFTLRQMQGEDAEAYAQMYNQSFIDHWNHHDLTVERVKYELTQPYYRPELDLIAVAPDGTFAAFCYSLINPEDNARKGCNEGWIASLGTRRGFRRMGLARAMLLTGLQQLKDAGMDSALLGVDAENPNGARQLYESVGFRKLWTSVAYVKEI